MKAILLVNMGGPQSLQGMHQFLWNMFTDKHILPFAKPFRYALATIITKARYKKSWAKYQLIGGTPLNRSTEAIAAALATELPDYTVRVAYSYTSPQIADQIAALVREGASELVVASLYPHYSITTWQSVLDDVQAIATRHQLPFRMLQPYYAHPRFIDYWVQAISSHLAQHSYPSPLLQFTGHSIPNTFLDKGDCYPREIEESARLIAQRLGLPYAVSYQSQIGKKWLGPITEDIIVQRAREGKHQIVLIPISFVNENLETLYDIGKVMIPNALSQFPELRISCVPIPEVDTQLVQCLADGIRAQTYHGCGNTCTLCGKKL